jgi:hypothetical protein
MVTNNFGKKKKKKKKCFMQPMRGLSMHSGFFPFGFVVGGVFFFLLNFFFFFS